MNISLDNVDPELVRSALFFFGGAGGFYWLKKDTRRVNEAVNHVEPGTPTLSERVDVMASTLEYAQAQVVVHKKETALRFDAMEKGQHEIRGIMAEVQADVSKIRESVDRRRAPRSEPGGNLVEPE